MPDTSTCGWGSNRCSPGTGSPLGTKCLEPDNQLAKAIGVPQTHISAITHGHRRITADTRLRLSHYLDMSEAFWTGLQEDYDREIATGQPWRPFATITSGSSPSAALVPTR